MSRHALVIGLGGTGQWVLTYLKKDLLEANDGTLPSNVKFLGLDTMPQPEADVRKVQGEEEIKVGSIKLRKDREFLHLGGDTWALVDQVMQGQHPHVGAWYRADHWKKILPRASFILDDGAGKNRQFGRLAVSKDLMVGPTNSKLWRGLTVALQGIEQLSADQKLEIIIVGSLAGGTGSGMFIDIAWLARQAAGALPVIVRGYFVLPRAFSHAAQDRAILARTFAAWRELNRFMSLDENVGLPSLTLDQRDARFDIHLGKKVFDVCYLVDTVREDQGLEAEPQKSVFPSIADAILAILDDEAGTAYTQWVTQNLTDEYRQVPPGQPMYSTLSTYSYKLPVYYDQQEFSHGFSKQVLNILLSPEKDKQDHITRLAEDQNLERGHRTGRMDCLGVLQDPRQEYTGTTPSEVAVANLFTQNLANIARKGGDQNIELVAQYVDMRETWMTPFTDVGQDPAIAQLQAEIDRSVGFDIMRSVPALQKDEKPKDALVRIKSTVENLSFTYYGGAASGGKEFTGKLGEELEKAKEYQLLNFRRLMRAWLLQTLMGNNADPLVAKGGKLGYAVGYLEGLIHHLNLVHEFMSTVESKRNDKRPELEFQNRLQKTYATAMHDASAKTLGIVTPPKALKGPTVYLQAWNNVIRLRKEAIVHQVVTSTIEQMLSHCHLVHDELQRWVWILTKGDPATGIVGLYGEVNSSLQAIRATRLADRELSSIQNILGEDTMRAYADEDLRRVLDGVKWEVEEEPDRFALKLTILLSGEDAATLDSTSVGDSREKLRSITQLNLQALLTVGQRRFRKEPQQNTVAEALRKKFPTAPALAADVRQYDLTLFRHQPGTQGCRIKSNLIRVSRGKDAAGYFSQLEQELRQDAGLDSHGLPQSYNIAVVNSADVHRCTVVRTDDLYDFEAFEAWHQCATAYQDEILTAGQDMSLVHAYPAEQNATHYERLVYDRFSIPYCAFHPRVVTLLENDKYLRLFYLGWALKYFCHADDQVNQWWELCVPGQEPLRLTAKERSDPADVLFRMMNNFMLVGRDLTPNSNRKVPYRAIEDAINKERINRPAADLLSIYEYEVQDPKGLVLDLTAKADIRTEVRGTRQVEIVERPEYRDLANLAHLIYWEEIEAIQRRR